MAKSQNGTKKKQQVLELNGKIFGLAECSVNWAHEKLLFKPLCDQIKLTALSLEGGKNEWILRAFNKNERGIARIIFSTRLKKAAWGKGNLSLSDEKENQVTIRFAEKDQISVKINCPSMAAFI